MPLPKGTVRVYKADKSGAKQFVGEDSIDHTPRDEKIRIKMGEAFDVVADRKQMEWKVLGSCQSSRPGRSSSGTTRTRPCAWKCASPAGGDWTIMESSLPATKEDAQDVHVRRAGAEARRDQSEVSSSRALVLTLASAGLRVEVLDPVADIARLGSRYVAGGSV